MSDLPLSAQNFATGAEMAAVAAAGGLVWASVLAQHLANVAARGSKYVVSDRSVPPTMEGFYGRATRTLSNNVESAAMLAPPALLLIALGFSNAATHLSALIYVAARVIFTLTYWLKVPVLRSLAWLTGMICCAIITYFAVAEIAARGFA